MRNLILILLALLLAAPVNVEAARRGGGKKSSASSYRPKTVHVKGHFRKDGTWVAPYTRSAPGTAEPLPLPVVRPTPAPTPTPTPAPVLVTPARDKDGKIKRDPAKRRAFMKSNPCPVTGQTTGACPGWEVHHVVPLYQGGTDEPSNMQWLTDEEHKERHRDL